MNIRNKGVLDIVFCAWINESALSVDKKIELARKAIENYPNAWDVIASKLPQGTNSICSTLNTPKYRKIDEHEELYVHEVNKTYGTHVGAISTEDIFGVSYPWLEDMQLLDDGSLLIMLTQERDDGSANELMFFRLTGF